MIPLSVEADAQVSALLTFCERLGRVEATRDLTAALERAAQRIERAPEQGFAAPRPYSALARLGRWRIREGAYCIAYRAKPRLMIVGVFHVSADIPGRA